MNNSNLNVQESLGEPNLENQLKEPSQISDEIQVWTQIIERKNTERIEKMIKEMDNVAGLPVRDVRSATSMKQSTLLTHHDGCLPEYGQELDKHFQL